MTFTFVHIIRLAALSVSSFLSFASLAAAERRMTTETKEQMEAMYPELGTASLDALTYSYNLTVDDDCGYALEVQFSHNPDFPVGSAETCIPGEVADFDGLPMLAGRYFYQDFPAYVQEATDLNHLSLDYNPCGHPTGGFLSPHYDLHYYMVTRQFRAEEMVCDLIPGTPVCNPEQSSEIGNKFFLLERVLLDEGLVNEDGNNSTDPQYALKNMPFGFSEAPTDAVINMGMHTFARELAPDTPSDWMMPTYILVAHDNQVICVEPMLPFHFVFGEEDHTFDSGDIEYVEQSIPTLPFRYEASFAADTQVTTVTLYGKSNVCQPEFNAAKENYIESQDGGSVLEDDGDEASTETDAATSRMGFSGTVAFGILGFVVATTASLMMF